MSQNPLTTAEWDAQFRRQAAWTRSVRSHLYQRVNLEVAENVLDVGCGTGVITEEIATRAGGLVVGLDIDPAMITWALEHDERSERATYRLGDAHNLPFPAGSFDVVLCHFLLLWVSDPARAVGEMARVTRPGGAVVACAEPDYGGRIDWPDMPLGRLQAEALRREGADPLAGRQLKAWFAGAGLNTEVGVYPCLWDDAALRAEFAGEWRLMAQTLAGLASPAEMERLKAADWAAIQAGTRTVFMPMFYAVGRKA